MKRGVSVKELTGLLFLALVVAVVVICSLLLKQCDAAKEEVAPVPTVEQAADTDGDVTDAGKTHGRKKSSGRRRKGSGTGAKKEKAAPVVRDPFSDTVPVEF